MHTCTAEILLHQRDLCNKLVQDYYLINKCTCVYKPKIFYISFRVSIPRSSLESPYRVRPHRRNSFDPSDSCALSEVSISV